MANEVLGDSDRLIIDPDPASKSGRSTRVIDYSPTERRGLPLSTMVSALLLAAVDTGTETPADSISRLHGELGLLSQQLA